MPVKPITISNTVRRASSLATVQPRTLRKTVDRGYDAVWKRLRAAFVRENPICVECEKRGFAVPMHDVDHILDIAKRPDLRLEWSNLQSLCKRCHGRKTRNEQNQAMKR